jgi:hypothetical protein
VRGIFDEIAQDFLIVTPFATFTPTPTLTATPTLTPTLEGGGGESGAGGDSGAVGGNGAGQTPAAGAGSPVAALPSASVVPTLFPTVTPPPTLTALPLATITPAPTNTQPPPPPPPSGGGGNPGPGNPPTATPIPPPPPPPSPPVISFSATVYNATEGAGTALISVVLSNAFNQNVTVNYVTSNGTAFTPNDYTPAGGTLTFMPGQTGLAFVVPIADDNVDDPDIETVLLNLSSPTNGTLGSSSATLEIADNDPLPVLQFTSSSISILENGTPLFDFSLDRPSGKTVTFVFADESPNSGDATVGVDYNSTFSLGSFAPDITGVSPTSTTVNWLGLIDDALLETPITETLVLQLANSPANATLGPVFTTTLTIIDDD